MPKDPTKNVDRYKIRGGQLNEFDFHQNQQQLAEQQQPRATNLIPGTPPEEKGEGLPLDTGKSRKPAKRKATKATKSAKATKSTKSTKVKKGATAKKLAVRKAAKKK